MRHDDGPVSVSVYVRDMAGDRAHVTVTLPAGAVEVLADALRAVDQ